MIRDGSKKRYWEINPNTFKQKEMVHLYLFNDALVVVSWKKNMITGKARMVADISWALNEIGFIDMKDSQGMNTPFNHDSNFDIIIVNTTLDITNAFKIVKHPDIFIYRTETADEKRQILTAIKRIMDEMLIQKRREKEFLKDSSNPKVSIVLSRFLLGCH